MGPQFTGSYTTFDTEAAVMASKGRPGDVGYALDTDMRYKCNGTGWFPTDALRVLRGTAPVNLLATGSTPIYTLPPTGYRFVVLGVHAEVLNQTGNVVTQATMSVGATSPNYSDIAASQGLLSVLTGAGMSTTNALLVATARTALTGSTTLYAKVNLNAIGPSVYTARFDLMGYFQP